MGRRKIDKEFKKKSISILLSKEANNELCYHANKSEFISELLKDFLLKLEPKRHGEGNN